MSVRVSPLAGATLFALSPFLIDVSDRIGFLHEDKAVAFGRLIKTDGQRDPIKVVANPANPELPWKLVVGLHRTMGARLEDEIVYAIQVSGKPEDLAELEASENLHRRTPAPIERAKFTAAIVQATQERLARQHGGLKQHQLAVKARWDRVRAGDSRVEDALTDETDDTCAKIAHVYGWEESVGAALGMSRRSIHNDLQLYRLLIEPFPGLAEPLSRHPVVGENASQLRLIAQVRSEADRRKVIELLLEEPELSVDIARQRVGVDPAAGPAPLPEQKFANAVMGNLDRMTAAVQKRNLDVIVRALKTDEVKSALRDRLNAELGAPAKISVADRDHATPQQAVTALSETIGIINRLLNGEGVDDEELEALRSQAQGVVFDIPEAVAPARGIVFEPGTLAHRIERDGHL